MTVTTATTSAPAAPARGAVFRRLVRIYLLPRWRALSVAMGMAAVVALCTGVLAALLEPATNVVFGRKTTSTRCG